MPLQNKIDELNLIINNITNTNNRFVILSDNPYGDFFYKKYGKHICIDRIINTRDIDIISPKQSVILAEKRSGKLNKITTYLSAKGYEKNKNYFFAKFFEEIYGAFVLGEAILNYVEITITEKCTLSCKHCSLFMPYFSCPKHVNLENIKHDLDVLFSKTAYIFHFRILGGEPLIHPNILDILKYVVTRYRTKIDFFDIATNGTIIPNDALLSVCKEGNVFFSVSDYDIDDTYKEKVDNLEQTLIHHGIHYNRMVDKRWFEIGFPLKIDHRCSDNEKINLFDLCSTEWRSFYNGKLFFCSVCSLANRAGLINSLPDDCYDFEKNFNIKDLFMFNYGINKSGFTSLCGMCKGYMSSVNRDYVKAGIQIKREDAMIYRKKVIAV